jgi:hypothetical protein
MSYESPQSFCREADGGARKFKLVRMKLIALRDCTCCRIIALIIIIIIIPAQGQTLTTRTIAWC